MFLQNWYTNDGITLHSDCKKWMAVGEVGGHCKSYYFVLWSGKII